MRLSLSRKLTPTGPRPGRLVWCCVCFLFSNMRPIETPAHTKPRTPFFLSSFFPRSVNWKFWCNVTSRSRRHFFPIAKSTSSVIKLHFVRSISSRAGQFSTHASTIASVTPVQLLRLSTFKLGHAIGFIGAPIPSCSEFLCVCLRGVVTSSAQKLWARSSLTRSTPALRTGPIIGASWTNQPRPAKLSSWAYRITSTTVARYLSITNGLSVLPFVILVDSKLISAEVLRRHGRRT